MTVLRPLVEVRLIGPEGREGAKVGALVDSGSSYTLCFDWMAQEVGIDPYDGPDMVLKIAGGLRRVFFIDVTLRLCPPETVPPIGGCVGVASTLSSPAVEAPAVPTIRVRRSR